MGGGLKILCPICSEVFKSTDSLCATSCGHIYHYDCLQERRRRSSSCAQCCKKSIFSHRLHLKIKEDTDNESSHTNEEPQEQLESMKASSAAEVTKLQKALAQLADEMQKEISASTELKLENIELKRRLQLLNINVTLDDAGAVAGDNSVSPQDNKNKQIPFKPTGHKAHKHFDRVGIIMDHMPLEDFNDVTEELAIKLAAIMDIFLSKSDLGHVEKIRYPTTFLLFFELKDKSHMTAIKRRRAKLTEIPKYADVIIKENWGKKPFQRDTQKHFDYAGVVVAHMPLSDYDDSPEELVMKLTAIMGVLLNKSDVGRIERIRQKTNFDLFFELKNRLHVIAIMRKMSQLLAVPKYSKVFVKENLDKETLHLFLYAGKKLRDKGFARVFYKEGVVKAKRSHNDHQLITINSKEQVDQLAVEALWQTKEENEKMVLREINCDGISIADVLTEYIP